MSFDRNVTNPDHTTHVPVKVAIPSDVDGGTDREPAPTPHLFQPGVKVTSRDGTKENIVRCVDWTTCQFRPVYDVVANDGKKIAGRTSWESFDRWVPVVELAPEEKKRQAAREELYSALQALDSEDLEFVQAFLTDENPEKALAQLRAFQKRGMVKVPEAEAPKAKEKKA